MADQEVQYEFFTFKSTFHNNIPVIITNLMVFAVNILMEALLLQLLHFHPNF